MKKGGLLFLISILGGIIGAFVFSRFMDKLPQREVKIIEKSGGEYLPSANPAFQILSPPTEFISASSKATESVVYIKTVVSNDYESMSLLDWFFYGGPRKSQMVISSGSGVIYKNDGYIITNNHVIEQAEQILVDIGKRTLEARLIGTDPSTDIAVIQVDDKDLPAIEMGSSKNLQVGEWVLAIGNPFNLTSTVTSGIVSAKGRNLSGLSKNFPIDYFIQTDAAINPGNSGGALVDATGKLVGINTAILSPSGAFSGYGFAVPVDIARKVADDLILYGRVQKAYLGVELAEIDDKVAKTLKLKTLDGVLISDVNEGLAAGNAGIKPGDVLLKLNGDEIESTSDFDEHMGYFRPGDQVRLEINRESKILNLEITLTNLGGTTDIVRKELFDSKVLGVIFEKLGPMELNQYRIASGYRVHKVKDGRFKDLGIETGFIITSVNGYKISAVDDLEKLLTQTRGRVRVEGLNKNGVRGYYSFYF